MATRTGLDSQIGVKEETTHGGVVVVDRFYPFLTESVTAERMPVVSGAIISQRLTPDTEQRKTGAQKVAGSVELDLYRENAAVLWKFALGTMTSASTAGSAPYIHTATLGDILPSFTYQKGVVGTTNGTAVVPFTYGGCKIPQFSFSGTVGDPGKFKFDVSGGVVETTGIALASATYANNAAVPFIFTEGSATVGGVAVRVQSFEFTGNNNLNSERLYAGDLITREQLRGNRFAGSGSLTVEFVDLTQYNLYRDGTDIDIVLAFSDGVNSVTLTIHTFLDGDTPVAAGTDVTLHDLKFSDVFGDGSDNDAITAVIVNSGSLTP